MAIEYKVRISEKQRKLIVRALTTTVANNRRSTSGEVLGDDEWMELISVFSSLNPEVGEAQFTLAGRKRAHAIGKCNKKQLRERHLGTL